MGLWSWLAERGLLPEQQARREARGSGPRYAAKPDCPFDYRLEYRPASEDHGRGFMVVRNADGQVLRWRTLPKSQGLESVNVVGEKYRLDALQDEAFTPGRPLQLIREPDNPHDPNAVAVYDVEGSLHAGYLPKDTAVRIAKKLDAGTNLRCYSMWEVIEGGRRVQLRLLLLSEDASVNMPQ